jgi:hypothetical protein
MKMAVSTKPQALQPKMGHYVDGDRLATARKGGIDAGIA